MQKTGLRSNQVTAFGQSGELTTTFEQVSELITTFGQMGLLMTASEWRESEMPLGGNHTDCYL